MNNIRNILEKNFFEDVIERKIGCYKADYDLDFIQYINYIESSKHSSDSIRLVRDNETLNSNLFINRNFQLNIEKVLYYLDNGYSIVSQGLQRNYQPIQDIVNDFNSIYYPSKCQVNSYMTPPNSIGLDEHYDNHDVFIYQVYGKKRWDITEIQKNTELVEFNDFFRTIPFDSDYRNGEVSVVLNPGDLLYIPRGFLHKPYTENSGSFHLTIGINHVNLFMVLVNFLCEAKAVNGRIEVSSSKVFDFYKQTLNLGFDFSKFYSEEAQFLARLLREYISSCYYVQLNSISIQNLDILSLIQKFVLNLDCDKVSYLYFSYLSSVQDKRSNLNVRMLSRVSDINTDNYCLNSKLKINKIERYSFSLYGVNYQLNPNSLKLFNYLVDRKEFTIQELNFKFGKESTLSCVKYLLNIEAIYRKSS